MPDPTTAHGWTVEHVDDGSVQYLRSGGLQVRLTPYDLRPDAELDRRPDATDRLARCIVDAARLGEARTLRSRLAVHLHWDECPWCYVPIVRDFVHADDCPFARLLALLGEDTP